MALKISRLRAITAVVAVSAAAASGYSMQKNRTPSVQAASVMSINAPAPKMTMAEVPDPVIPASPAIGGVTRAESQAVLFLPGGAPVLPDAPAEEAISLASAGVDSVEPSPTPGESAVLNPLISECETGFTAMAAPGAMVELTLEAPCYGGQTVDIFHAGARFTGKLDMSGMMQIAAPALEEDAFFNVLFADGQTKSTNILMLTVSDYQRVALYWKGNAGFALYALEGGASYGSDEGYISAETAYSPARGIAGEGGFISRLGQGEQGYHMVVYSYPAMLTDTAPAPEISIEAQVLAENCGREITATLIRGTDTGAPESTPLTMVVPGCDAVGEYLVLKNLPQNLRIAAN